jgi:hypothetical protein
VKETTDHGSPFQIAVSSRSARILQAAAPTADNSTLTPEDEANRLADRAIVFFTVVILVVSVILAVRSELNSNNFLGIMNQTSVLQRLGFLTVFFLCCNFQFGTCD